LVIGSGVTATTEQLTFGTVLPPATSGGLPLLSYRQTNAAFLKTELTDIFAGTTIDLATAASMFKIKSKLSD